MKRFCFLVLATVARGVQALSYQAGFVSKLRDAVRFQSERVESLAGEVERARLRWMGLHREVENRRLVGPEIRGNDRPPTGLRDGPAHDLQRRLSAQLGVPLSEGVV